MRNFLIGAACAAAAFGATLSQASAAIIDYYISGDGTGALNGVDWSGDFLITIAGDNSTVSGNEINPVVSVTITIPGDGTATLSIPTRLGVNYGDSAVFLGRVGAPRAPDLFDFYLSASDAAAFTFQADYGPVIGTGVFALNQFQNVTTSEGPLTISSSGDVLFYTTGASLIPEPSTWAMMLLGFAGLGFAGYRKSRRTTVAAA